MWLTEQVCPEMVIGLIESPSGGHYNLIYPTTVQQQFREQPSIIHMAIQEEMKWSFANIAIYFCKYICFSLMYRLYPAFFIFIVAATDGFH